MLLAISSSGKVGLGIAAGLFIAFALASAFWFPRRNPNFPGDRLGLFVLVSALLFAVTIGGVIVFAVEEEEHGAEAAETHGTETGEAPATTGQETTGQETTGQETTGQETAGQETTGEETTGEEEPSEPGGDAAAGEAVFASAGCGGCHTLEAAGASGTVGPNLDEAKPPADLVVERVTNGMGAMPSFKGQLDEQQIQDVAAYVVESTSG